jgi:hypothetical protein
LNYININLRFKSVISDFWAFRKSPPKGGWGDKSPLKVCKTGDRGLHPLKKSTKKGVRGIKSPWG